uniref:Uncharacterized protein n=1 Tax=Oryza brachyantha TaxID=4533 RepID=J3KZU1_ORYBR
MADLVARMVVGPLVSMLKEKASSYLLEQYKVMEGMETQHKILKRKLPAILDVISDAEEQASEQREGAKAWLEELKAVAYEANQVFDEFNYEALRREAKKNGHYTNLGFDTVKLFRSHNPVMFRYRMGKKLCRIVHNMEVLVSEMNAFGFRFQPQFPASKQWRQTSSDIFDPIKIATKSREEDKRKVVNILLSQSSNVGLAVVPIVGIGGMGKTTLAQLVYNDPEIQKHFQLKLWVCVSENFDVDTLAKNIVEAATKGRDGDEETRNNSPLDRLKKLVSRKRFLVVLDDVWNREADKWEKLKACLLLGSSGSVVLATTREKGIAEIMGTVQAYDLAALKDNFIEEIIKSRAFSSQGSEPNELVEMVSEVARKCVGSPLAATALGSVLRTKTSVEEWKVVLSRSNCSEGSGILPILKLSYIDMPSHMKQCFAFCAVFPKDCEIDVDKLIQLWIANDLIPQQNNIHLETAGNRIFNELASRSFFQDVKQVPIYNDEWTYGYFSRTTCKIHDLMHDVALSIMGNECVTVTDEPGQRELLTHTARHVLLSCYESETLFNDYLKNIAPAIQTLLCGGLIIGSLPHLSKCNSVKAIQYESCIFRLKPKHLLHLRYLDLFGSRIDALPEDISILYNLRTLILSHCIYLDRLPRQMKYMTALRHLYTDNCPELKSIPQDLGQLTSLQTLSCFVAGTGSNSLNVRALHHLNLCGLLELCHLENVTAADAEAANLSNMKQLRGLILRWDSSHEDNQHHYDKVLKGLKPHHGLQALRISSYQGSRFPTWMGILQNMVELILCDCGNSKKLPPLSQVPALKVLRLYKLGKLQFLCSGVTPFTFPKLKELILVNLPAFERCCEVDWMQRELMIFPQLEKLFIQYCKLIALPEAGLLRESNCGDNATAHSAAFPSLKVLKLKNLCSFQRWESVEGIKGRRIIFPQLDKLVIHSCPELTALPEAVILEESNGGDYTVAQSAFPALKVLKLKQLSRFQRWASVEGIQVRQAMFPKLEKLVIYCCPELTALPEASLLGEMCVGHYALSHSAFPALKELKLTGLNIFQRWDSVKGIQGQLTVFPQLENLLISSCPKLTALPEASSVRESCGDYYTTAHSVFPVLKALELYDLRMFRNWGGLTFPRLEVLTIRKCHALIALPAATLVGKDITGCSAFPQLKELRLDDAEGFNIWGAMGKTHAKQPTFHNLECVYIKKCPKLRTLPRAPKLNVLHIVGANEQISLWAPRYMTSLSNLKLWVQGTETTQPDGHSLIELVDGKDNWNHQSPLTVMKLHACNLYFSSGAQALWACFAQLKDLEIHSCNSFVHWPEKEFRNLISLRGLWISGCNKLTGHAKAPGQSPSGSEDQILPQLESLKIESCESLVEVFSAPASLMKMDIWFCPELESIFSKHQCRSALTEGPSSDTMATAAVSEFLPCLEYLSLHGCDSLSGVLHLPPSLKKLYIEECSGLESLQSHSGEPPQLVELRLSGCQTLSSLPNVPQAYSYLTQLTIHKCPAIKALPTSLQQRLPSLRKKHLDACFEGPKPTLSKPRTWRYAIQRY